MLPNFVCVGPGRAGTSWLYEVFLEHPEIGLAKNIKETQFFNEHWRRGLEWYESFFEGCNDRKAVGEISNRYIFDAEVAERIRSTMPDGRILICVRNPYDRIQSNYLFKLREGQLSCSFPEALIARPDLIDENRYSTLIAPYLERFPRERLFFLVFDDIANSPQALCKRLYSFLGVDDAFLPGVLNKKVNEAVVPRLPFIGGMTKRIALLLRRLGMYRVLTWAKRSTTVKRALFRAVPAYRDSLMSPEARKMLAPVFATEIQWLQNTLGRDLSHWVA